MGDVLSFLRAYTSPKVFGLAVLGALGIGVLLGFIARANEAHLIIKILETTGSIFTTLLQIAVIPLIFTSIVLGISGLRGLGSGRDAARLGGKTIVWFGVTSLIAVAIGIVVGNVFDPGRGGLAAEMSSSPTNPQGVTTNLGWHSLDDFINEIIPKNFFSGFVEGKTLQVLFLALIIGAAAYKLGDKAKPFVNLTESLFEITQVYLTWVIRLAPLGVLGLIGAAMADYGGALLRPLGSTVLAVYAGCLFVLFVVYPVLLKLVARVSPRRFFGKSWTAIQFAFVSQSSGATLPLTKQATVNLGVHAGYSAFATPLASAVKMDGCMAVFQAVAAVFIANISGLELGIGHYLGIVAVAVFGALASGGTACWLTALTLTTTVIGLSSAQVALGIALIYSINPILDMARSATNVAGQIVVPTIVARRVGLLDENVLHGRVGSAPVTADLPLQPTVKVEEPVVVLPQQPRNEGIAPARPIAPGAST